jgi:HEAT repeat protein
VTNPKDPGSSWNHERSSYAGDDTAGRVARSARAQGIDIQPLHNLGAEDWRVRREAVDRLVEAQMSDEDARRLLDVLRSGHSDYASLNAAIQVLVQTDVDVLPYLLPLLESTDADLRCYVALTLGERGDVRAAAALVALLGDVDPNVRAHAIEAVGRLKASVAVDKLVSLAGSGDFAMSFPALNALAAIEDERVVSVIAPLLKDPILQSAAIEAIGRLGGLDSICLLVELLDDEDVYVGEVAQALVMLHDRHKLRYGDDEGAADRLRKAIRPTALRKILAAVDTGANSELPALVRLLALFSETAIVKSFVPLIGRPELRPYVVESIVIGGAAVVGDLLALLSKADLETQCAVVAVLGRIGDRRALPSLLQLLESDDTEEVVAVIEALAPWREERIRTPLLDLFGHIDKKIRHAAAVALGAFRDSVTLQELLTVLSDPQPRVRESALKAVAFYESALSLEPLLSRAGDENAAVRRAALELLPLVEDDRILVVLSEALLAEQSAVRAAAVVAFSKRRWHLGREGTLNALTDGDPWVRCFALRSVLAHEPAVMSDSELLRLAKHDDAIQVRVSAIAGLRSRCVPYAEWKGLAFDAEDDVALATIDALGDIRTTESLDILVEVFREASSKRRAAAIRSIAGQRSLAAMDVLYEGVLDSDRCIGTSAIRGLASIGTPATVSLLLSIALKQCRRELCIAELAAEHHDNARIFADAVSHAEVEPARVAVECLIRIGTSEACDLLRIAASDARPVIRFAAATGLAYIEQKSRLTRSPTRLEGTD